MTIVTTRAHLSWGSWQSQDDRSVNIPVKESKLRTRVAPTTFKHIRYRLAHHRASLVVYERRMREFMWGGWRRVRCIHGVYPYIGVVRGKYGNAGV